MRGMGFNMLTEETKKKVQELQQLEQMYVLYSQMTKMPFVTCDPESFNDQVWVFTDKDKVQEYAKKYTEQKYLLMAAEIKKPQMLGFFIGMFAIGVNSVMLIDAEGEMELELTDIVRQPDYSKIPEEKRPLMNPQLQLSGIYYMQEMRRPLKKEERTANIQEMEEEMAANTVKSRYLLALDMGDVPEGGEVKKENLKVPYIKDNNGNIFLPIFTDPLELQKFARGKKLRSLIVPFTELEKYQIKDAQGFAINPFGFNLILMNEQIPALKKRFHVGDEEKQQ